MSADTRAWVIRRILVALDASRHSVAALQVAADLASHLEAELVGLFVEDINLLRLAELPFAREVGSYSGTRRRLNTRQVERQLKVQAERARRALEAYADRASVRWSFEVTRGVVAPCVLAAASDADLVILGRASHGARTTGGLGSTARGVVSAAACHALVVSQERGLRLPVLVLYDGSQLGQRTLAVAAALVREEERHLIVFVMARGPKSALRVKRRAVDALREQGLVARYRMLVKPSANALASVIGREGCGTLVLPAKCALLDRDAVVALLDTLDLPALLIR